MKQNFWERRISTLFAFFLLIVGIGATTFLTNFGVRLFGHAAPSENPENVRITNTTDTSFTVTYKTETSVIGTISVGTNDTTKAPLSVAKEIFFDDRDQLTGVPTPHVVHSITARNLKPNTTYVFTIINGKTNYLNNTVPFTITTGPAINTKLSLEPPLAGGIVMADGNQVDEALVYVTAAGGQTLSALAKTDGSYSIPLNTMRANNLSSLFSFSTDTVLQVLLVGTNTQSQVSLLASKRNPVPTITLGNNYDFTINTNTTPLASSSALPAGFSTYSSNTTGPAVPQIITPQKDQKFTDPQPLLEGKALPNTKVQITIHSANDILATVTTDANGNWSFRPAVPLAPGQHTITIVTTDASGILQRIQQTFTIFQSGVQVAQAATPSATPIIPTATPSPIPTATSIPSVSPTPSTGLTSSPSPIPTVTASPSATLTPSPALSPSPSPTPSPTVIPSPTILLTPITTPKPLPPTGSNTLVTAGITTLVTTIAGIVLFLLSRGVTL